MSQFTTVKLSFPNTFDPSFLDHTHRTQRGRLAKNYHLTVSRLYQPWGNSSGSPSSTRFETKLLQFVIWTNASPFYLYGRLEIKAFRSEGGKRLPRTVDLFIELPRQEDDTVVCFSGRCTKLSPEQMEGAGHADVPPRRVGVRAKT